MRRGLPYQNSETYREKPDRRVKSVCTYCGTGCGIYIDVKDNRITGITTDELDPVGRGNLCVKGRSRRHIYTSSRQAQNSPDKIRKRLQGSFMG